MTIRVAAALVLLAVAAPGAAAAADQSPKAGKADPEVGRCVKRVRGDQRTCIRAATERCREAFETDLTGCYRSNADCARACITEQSTCRGEPQVSQDGCKLACASDVKVEMQRCRVAADTKKCEPAAKVRALKCKQKCAADAAPALEQCLQRFDGCLAACGKAVVAP